MPQAVTPTAPSQTRCRNCGAAAPGHYCTDCGQETRVALPTAGEFVRESAGRLVAFDGRLWRTLFALVFRPGLLTREYLAGRRRRYVRPARLFVLLSLLAFAVIGFVRSPELIADEVVFTDSAAEARRAAGAGAAKPESDADGAALVAGKGGEHTEARDDIIGIDDDLNLQIRLRGVELKLPEPLRKRYERFKRLSKEDRAEHLYAGMLRYGPTMVVLMLPVFALLLKFAYLGSGRRYPGRPQRFAEHLVYSAHLHAFAALMVILLVLLPFGWARAGTCAWGVYYVLRARSRVYGGRRWAGVLRAFVVGLIYSWVAVLGVAGLVVAATMLR